MFSGLLISLQLRMILLAHVTNKGERTSVFESARVERAKTRVRGQRELSCSVVLTQIDTTRVLVNLRVAYIYFFLFHQLS